MADLKEIVVLTTHMTNGGAQRVISELIQEWNRCGHKVTVIQTKFKSYDESYSIPKSIEIVNLKSHRYKILGSLQNVSELCKYLRGHPNAVVLAFLNSCINLATLSSLFVKNTFIFSERNDPERYPTKSYKRKIRDILFTRADVCVFQTTTAKLHFGKSIREKGYVIPNPINPELPKPYTGVREKTIIAVGRLSKQKNFPMLINAFKKINELFPEYKLYIYGNDEGEKQYLVRLTNELGLEDSVYIMGFVSNIYDIMSRCGIYVSSSDYEGISNSMLEALGMGVPTVCTDCPAGGAEEMISNGINGLLVPVGDVEALFSAMKKIIENKEFAEQISLEASKIRDKYPLSMIAKMWIDIM